MGSITSNLMITIKAHTLISSHHVLEIIASKYVIVMSYDVDKCVYFRF